jgi:pimeloyl-ACP methyl ester carboxylesterase
VPEARHKTDGVTAPGRITVKEYKLKINGINYACVEAGEGPLLLLSHGTFGGKRLLLPQLEHLSRFFRCVTFDWRGHGDTGYDPAGWIADDLVQDQAVLIHELGEKGALLAGVSQGGAISMRTALAYPDRVLGLVNMCGGPGGPPSAVAALLDRFAHILADEQDEGVRRETAITFARGHFHAPGFIEREPQRFAGEIDVILSHRRESVRLLPGVPKSYVDISPRLHAIACPTLILWATHDGRPALGATLAKAIPGAELVTIANAGHHVNVDAPQETSAALEVFLRGIKP